MSGNGRTQARTLHDSRKHPILDYAACRIERKADFHDFTFENAVRFWGEVNPDFFKGTVVSSAAAEVLARGR